MQHHRQAHGGQRDHAAEGDNAATAGHAGRAQAIAAGVVQRQQVVGPGRHVQGEAGRDEQQQAGKVHFYFPMTSSVYFDG
ncbi:hypothetical protein D3C79_845790 [compost metagenome]